MNKRLSVSKKPDHLSIRSYVLTLPKCFIQNIMGFRRRATARKNQYILNILDSGQNEKSLYVCLELMFCRCLL